MVYSQQEEVWTGSFGKNYTDRSILTPELLDEMCVQIYGVSRTEMNRSFLEGLDTSARILEVGTNMGSQLAHLQAMGFKNLYGIELQSYAVELAKQHTQNINIIQGSAFDLPFRDGFFDLVFTAGVLIHISPTDLPRAMSEIVRCSGHYILGTEYYASETQIINYRGHENLMWRADYARLYQEQAPQLKCVKQKFYKYLQNDNVDVMFLLSKHDERQH